MGDIIKIETAKDLALVQNPMVYVDPSFRSPDSVRLALRWSTVRVFIQFPMYDAQAVGFHLYSAGLAKGQFSESPR